MPKNKPGRPKLPSDERRVTLTVRVKPATKREVERRAKTYGESQGRVIDEAVDRHTA